MVSILSQRELLVKDVVYYICMHYIFLLLVWGASLTLAAFPPSPPSSVPPIPANLLDDEYIGGPSQEPNIVQSLSDAELLEYKKASKEKCLNILIGSEERGFYYNGEPLDVGEKNPWGLKAMQARVAGDRLAYIWRDRGRDYVVVDDVMVDTLSKVDSPNSQPQLKLNQKHVAFIQLVAMSPRPFRSTFHLIFDGKDMGQIDLLDYKLNGDHVIYDVVEDRTLTKSSVFIDGKKKVKGSNGDYDGKNFGYGEVGSNGKLIYNGKKLGYGGDLTLKDGHRAYILGRTENAINPKVYYDGKVVGPGRRPVIEKNHLAYARSPMDVDKKSADERWRLVYDGREQGIIGGYDYNVSLAGDHFAYVRFLDQSAHPFKDKDAPGVITIDGTDYPGTFAQGMVYVEITEKTDKSVCE